MKITKSYLKQIILEEHQKMLSEGIYRPYTPEVYNVSDGRRLLNHSDIDTKLLQLKLQGRLEEHNKLLTFMKISRSLVKKIYNLLFQAKTTAPEYNVDINYKNESFQEQIEIDMKAGYKKQTFYLEGPKGLQQKQAFIKSLFGNDIEFIKVSYMTKDVETALGVAHLWPDEDNSGTGYNTMMKSLTNIPKPWKK